MDPLKSLAGIVTVLNTPFTASNLLDEDSLRRHVRYAMDAGVAGFLVPAMASEVGKLSNEEKLTMTRVVLEETRGARPVIGGTSAPDRARREEMACAMIDLGCDAILVNIPFENEEQYGEEVRAIASRKPPMLMIQDWDFAGGGLPELLIMQLFEEVPCFRSLKIETTPAGTKYSRMLELTGGRLHIAGGWAVTQMIEGLDRGVHAFMPTGMHEIYTRIHRLFMEGDREGARRLFFRLAPVLAFSNQHLDISIHFFKRLLHRQGIFDTDRVRDPILPFDVHHSRIADELVEVVVQLCGECR